MSKPTDSSPVQQAAQLCYRLLREPLAETGIPEEDLNALAFVVGSPISPEDLLQITSSGPWPNPLPPHWYDNA